MGALAKNRMEGIGVKKETLPYLSTALKVHKYYQDILDGLNTPKIMGEVETKVDMPFDYSKKKKFSYDETNSWLHFITGDYDFIQYQDGITPAESIIHPNNTLAMLTKSRTILDLFVSRQDKEPLEWGRVSLIKFRYRWEMYILSENLKDKQNEDKKAQRTRLMLSSAWEHGVLITWHESAKQLWEDASYDENGSVRYGTMDTQTNLLAFRCKKDNKIIIAKTCDDKYEIDAKNEILIQDRTSLGKILGSLLKQGIASKMSSTTGRFDYVIEWKADSPKELAEIMLRLPLIFWQNIDHINTTFRDKEDEKSFYFVSEIAVNLFKNNRKHSH
jgi:predicted transcriptional regulator